MIRFRRSNAPETRVTTGFCYRLPTFNGSRNCAPIASTLWAISPAQPRWEQLHDVRPREPEDVDFEHERAIERRDKADNQIGAARLNPTGHLAPALPDDGDVL